MQRPERNAAQRRMLDKDKEILMQSVIHDEDFKFYENFNYFKRQFDNSNDFKQILEENFFDYELLKAALVRKHVSIVNYLINNCCCRVRNPNKINLEETPLHLSLSLPNISIFKTILKKDASIYDKNLNGETPLYAAFKEEHYKAVTILLNYISTCNLSFSPDNKDDVLHFHIACMRKHMSSVKLYLSLGFDVNSDLSIDSADYSGITPLLYLLSQYYYSDVTEFVQLFIDSGVDINSYVPLCYEIFGGFTPLHFAARFDSLELVELFLKNGADWNRSDKNGQTPLHVACEKGKNITSIEIIEILLNCAGSLVAVDKFGKTPIHIEFVNIFAPPYERNILNRLISKEELDILDMLLTKQPLTDNLTDNDGLSLFHIVCTRNMPDLVNNFLNSGAKIDSCVSAGKFKGFTALHFAVYFNQKAVVELLLKRNAPVNMKTHDWQNTPLHLACAITPVTLYEATGVFDECQRRISIVQRTASRNSQFDIIKLLLLYGAAVEAQNIFDFTPLFHACSVDPSIGSYVLNYISSKEGYSRFTEIFKVLFSNNADINCTNNKQLSIFHVICNDLTEISDELMECFITTGADINAADRDGLTPLHYAAIRSKEKLMKSFLKYKANINVKCESLKTPLQYAISSYKNYRNKESITNCITTLLENGSDFNVRAEDGRTLLHDAVSFSIFLLIKKLLYYGADINAEDSSGNSIVCSLGPGDIETKIEVLCVVVVHVQKLLALGCYVNRKLQKFYIYLQEYCKTNLSNTNFPTIMDNAFDECTKEINRSKIRNIDSYTSLYKYLIKDPHDLSKHVQNIAVFDIFERGNLDEEFPLYSYLLKLQYKRSLLRSDALKCAKESLMYATRTSLPDVCYDSILRYLTNEEIVNLKVAVGVNERCSSKRKLNVIDLSETIETIKLQKKD